MRRNILQSIRCCSQSINSDSLVIPVAATKIRRFSTSKETELPSSSPGALAPTSSALVSRSFAPAHCSKRVSRCRQRFQGEGDFTGEGTRSEILDAIAGIYGGGRAKGRR